MRRIITIAALALAACEGEPPKVPAGATPVTPEPSATVVAETPAPEAKPPVAAIVTEREAGSPAPCAVGGGGVAEGGAAVATASTEAGAVVAARATVAGMVVTTPAGAAANAVVYLEDAPIEPTGKKSVTIDNSKMNFFPYVAVIPAGGKIVFHNSDPFPHNVFSPDGEKFNVGNITENGGATAHTFKTAGAYTLLCNLHPGMIGYVFVSPSSYFARADAKGRFAIKDVPAGTYKVSAWAPRLKTATQPATVAGSDITLDFELHR